MTKSIYEMVDYIVEHTNLKHEVLLSEKNNYSDEIRNLYYALTNFKDLF